MQASLKLNKPFIPLWKNRDKRYHLITGGRGSGKSFQVAAFLLDLMLREAGQVILFTRFTLTSAHISIIPEFVEKIELMGVQQLFTVTKTEIICNNGSKLLFRGIRTSSGNQTANLKSIQGVTTWVLDEAEELVDMGVFDKIDDSIRSKTHQNRVILVLNPTTRQHWIYDRFVEQKQDNCLYIHTTYLDNAQHISQSFKDKAQQIKQRNPKTYQHTYMGAWLEKADGVVFDNWIEGKFDDTLQTIYGQDFGFSNDPTTFIKIAVDHKLKKLYLHECFYLPKLSTDQIFELNKSHAGSNLIVADSAEPRLISELRKKGNNITEAKKGQGSVSAGLLAMLDYQIVVTPESTNIKKELCNYVWLDKSSKLVIDDYNHAIDGIRYAFTHLTQKNRNFVI